MREEILFRLWDDFHLYPAFLGEFTRIVNRKSIDKKFIERRGIPFRINFCGVVQDVKDVREEMRCGVTRAAEKDRSQGVQFLLDV